jgi:DNA polymerase III psi subunit
MTDNIDPKAIPYFFHENIYNIQEKKIKEEDKLSSQKSVLIVLDTVEPENTLLEKILTAVSLNLEEVEIVSPNSETDPNQFQKVILFTTGEWSMLKPHNKYQISELRHTQFLYADPLSIIGSDVALKKRLWDQLKILFQ